MSKFNKIFASACYMFLLANLGWANSAHIGNYQAEDADFVNAQIRNEFFTKGSGWSGTGGSIDFNEGGWMLDWNVTESLRWSLQFQD